MDTDFSGDGFYLWRAASAVLFWETTEDSCRAVNMFPADIESTRVSGSLALLWPLFLSLGFGQFVETLTCALQGRHPIQEVGMTIFEHSLAFAEAEAMVTKPLSINATRFLKPKSVFVPDGTSLLLPRTKLSKIANVPLEVLLIAFISSFSHLTSNSLAITGVRSKVRLITTAIWGLAYMSTFAWSFSRLTSADTVPENTLGMLRFPTVCIVGFIPHLLILAGIATCGLIYLLALIITVLSPPPGQPRSLTIRERFSFAYSNLHANIHLSAITPLTINWNEDFYTAILKIGFTVLTAASEAVFLNEGTKVNVHAMTWLERQRLEGVLNRRRQFRQSLANIPSELRGDILAVGVDIIDNAGQGEDTVESVATSGYARERKARGSKASADARTAARNDPAGLEQRRSRFNLTYQFFKSISKLIALIHARLTIALLRKMRITYRPRWLRRLAGPRTHEKVRAVVVNPTNVRPRLGGPSEPWLTLDDRSRIRPDGTFDVETFAKERLRQSGFYDEGDTNGSEERLNDYLYSWWRNGGRWGDIDTSSDYAPPTQDDDTTSVVSYATSDNDDWSDVDDEEDGQRTPTRETYRQFGDEGSLLEDALDLTRLSQLLDPRTKDDREEAKLLARHLQSSNIMTRSQYRKTLDREEAKILTTSRYKMGDTVKMTAEEEEQLLEDLILSKRSALAPQVSGNAGSWDAGAEGMGSEGPQCVVCQMAPRTVLVWPCGCLSLCDDCRVGLASKNYTTCVCCRTNVAAYSRLYVP